MTHYKFHSFPEILHVMLMPPAERRAEKTYLPAHQPHVLERPGTNSSFPWEQNFRASDA